MAEGQEDRQSILSNASGSAEYEEFVSGLAWEVRRVLYLRHSSFLFPCNSQLLIGRIVAAGLHLAFKVALTN